MPLHVISILCSLCTMMSSLMKIKMLSSSNAFVVLINDVGNSWDVSASVVCLDSCGNGSCVTNLPLLVLPFAASSRFINRLRMGCPDLFLSALLA